VANTREILWSEGPLPISVAPWWKLVNGALGARASAPRASPVALMAVLVYATALLGFQLRRVAAVRRSSDDSTLSQTFSDFLGKGVLHGWHVARRCGRKELMLWCNTSVRLPVTLHLILQAVRPCRQRAHNCVDAWCSSRLKKAALKLDQITGSELVCCHETTPFFARPSILQPTLWRHWEAGCVASLAGPELRMGCVRPRHPGPIRPREPRVRAVTIDQAPREWFSQ
jgi:hypothetical protein